MMNTDGGVMTVIYCTLMILFLPLGSGYEVEILISPTVGPYQLRNTINCSCSINPIPTVPVTYQWNIPSVIGRTINGQNISYTPYEDDDLHFIWFYCNVLSGSSVVAQGKKLIEVHGFIYPLGNSVRNFTTGETLSLQINISSTLYQARYIRNLTWYHNGSQVCSCRTRNNGTELVIPNAQSSDAGMYEVKISSLTFGKPDCDSRLLPLLESSLLNAPVIFVLTQGVYKYDPEDYLPRRNYFVTDNSSVTLSSEHCFHVNTTQQLMQYHHIRWYHNGSYIGVNTNDLRYNSSFLAEEHGDIKFKLKISNLSSMDIGDYTGIITSYNILSWCSEYLDFLPIWWYIFGNDFPVAVLHFSINKFNSPLVTLTSTVEAAFIGEHFEIMCSAVGGNPDVHHLVLARNDTTLASVYQSNSVTYSVKNVLQYGLYSCTVKSLYSTAMKTFILREKADFHILLVTDHFSCEKLLNLFGQPMITESINQTFQNICDCLPSTNMTSLKCTSSQLLELNGTVTYSDDSGQTTASTLVAMLQGWILNSEDASIEISGNIFQLRLSRFYLTSSASSSPVIISKSSKSIPGIAGSFIGGLVTGILLSILILCIFLCVIKVKADKQMAHAGSTTTSNKGDEVDMGTNQAYETVNIRYASTSESQLHQRSIANEPVYELPAL